MPKNKKFQPPAGFVVAVHINGLGIRAVAKELSTDPAVLGKALERAGFALTPDIMDLSADATKVILMQDEKEPKSD